MERVLCIANQKGGVGKTTTAISLAAGIARAGNRTLLIDLDPQCNATTGLGAAPSPFHPLVTGEPIQSTILATPAPGLDLLPGCRSFADIETMAGPTVNTNGEPVDGDETIPPEYFARMKRITRQLTDEIKGYDYVLIDSPPSLGRLTRTALCWSTDVLMPIQCEYFAMEGLVRMVRVIREVMTREKGTLAFAGIVLTMYDPSLELTLEVDREVRDFFGEIVYKTVIPRDVAISEAPSHGKSIFDYAPRSRGARAYAELCLEVMEHV